VYAYTPSGDESVNIDLCNSEYDTKVYVYENGWTPGAPYACNDDACGYFGYQSALYALDLFGGNTYYIVVDGYGSEYGEYEININEYIEFGGIYVNNNLIANNTAGIYEFEEPAQRDEWFVGGGVLCEYTTALFANNTISDNEAWFDGGGLYCYSAAPTLIDNIFWGNESETLFREGEQVYLDFFSFPIFIYNDIQDGQGGFGGSGFAIQYNNNIDADPEFAYMGEHQYRLDDNSPCINAGVPDTTGLRLLPYDLRDGVRIYNEGIIDIGAYEFGNNMPSDIYLSGNTVPENEDPGYFVGTFTTEDVDEEDTHTYTLVPGEGDDDNDKFEIIADELFSTVTFNYEAPARGLSSGAETSKLTAEKESYRLEITPIADYDGTVNTRTRVDSCTIRVRSTDSGLNNLYVEKRFIIEILDVNDPPTIVLPDNFSFAEDTQLIEDFIPYLFDEDLPPDSLSLSVRI
jgi:hypothetical protein